MFTLIEQSQNVTFLANKIDFFSQKIYLLLIVHGMVIDIIVFYSVEDLVFIVK